MGLLISNRIMCPNASEYGRSRNCEIDFGSIAPVETKISAEFVRFPRCRRCRMLSGSHRNKEFTPVARCRIDLCPVPSVDFRVWKDSHRGKNSKCVIRNRWYRRVRAPSTRYCGSGPCGRGEGE